ncbi:hypothetical protein CALVIDRAFT_532068 [Calocera viscosa TUFC12733]|uniref:Uncharacterized protein n=1 Tax=Calocera viscosa (strain TUFC12733) TaxID=1330018 RepID=A0A167FGZ5_CALVF|nr:hypothetical protein CALVIDRAFT_532068 [Calocera viscosa TUFC12733]
MPEVQESNVFVVPDCEGWNGRITADDLVAWFAIHDRGGGLARRTIINQRGRLQKMVTFWNAHRVWYLNQCHLWNSASNVSALVLLKLQTTGVLGYCFARTDAERAAIIEGTPPGEIVLCAGRWRPTVVEGNIGRVLNELGEV